jgi:protein tyrosine phosphatase type 4A
MNGYRNSGSSVAVQMRSPIHPPTFVEYEGLRFLIADAPSDNNLIHYINAFEAYNVTDVVRVCEPTYNIAPLEERNIRVHDWVFGDGEAPPNQIVTEWLNLVNKRFSQKYSDETKRPTIACHCVAGLGRAPVLVAIALIEAGMSALDSVSFIRERRHGAINNRQLKYLESYKKRPRPFPCIIC